jgi:hypothetical protein
VEYSHNNWYKKQGQAFKVCAKAGTGRKVGLQKSVFVQIFNKPVSEKEFLNRSR